MDYIKFQPCAALQHFVECYFIWQSNGENVSAMRVESPPNGFCSIVFNTGDSYSIQNKKYKHLQVPQAFVAGQSIYSYTLFLNGHISIAGIVFKPAGLASLFDLPVYEFTEERIDLYKIFAPTGIEQIMQQLQQITDPKQKAVLLETFVWQQFEKKKPEPDFIDKAANLIVARNGMLDVHEWMKDVYMSRRNFERKFFKKVGLSPKYYARVRRMSYIMNTIAGKKKADWASIIAACEFYDQSHFIKDFIEFTGRSPQQYVEDNQELANLIDKPKQQQLN